MSQSYCSGNVSFFISLILTSHVLFPGQAPTRTRATQDLYQLAISEFALPGDPRFPLNHLYSKPGSDAGTMRDYLRQIRQECGQRVLELSWPTTEKTPIKFWTCFSKRKFLNTSLGERK